MAVSPDRYVAQWPLIEITKTDDTEWETNDLVYGVVRVGDAEIPIYDYIDWWGDGGRTPQEALDKFIGSLVRKMVKP